MNILDLIKNLPKGKQKVYESLLGNDAKDVEFTEVRNKIRKSRDTLMETAENRAKHDLKHKLLVQLTEDIKKTNKTRDKELNKQFKELKEVVKSSKTVVPKPVDKVALKEPVEVKNFPKSFKVNTEKEVDIRIWRKPIWFREEFDLLAEKLETALLEDRVLRVKEENPIKIPQVNVTGKGGAAGIIPFKTSEGRGQKALVDEAGRQETIIDGVDYVPGKSGVDPSTETLNVLDYSHHELHEGNNFYVKGWTDLDGAGASIGFLWRVGDSVQWPHAQWSISGEAEFNLTLYEGASVHNVGASIQIFNNNRNSLNTAQVQAYVGPTIAVYGNTVWAGKIGSGKSATEARSNAGEFIGRQNTDYIFLISKIATAVHWIDYDFSWYQHTNKNT